MSEVLEFIIAGKDQFTGTFDKLKNRLPGIKTLAIAAAGGITALSGALIATAKSTATAYDKYQKFSDQTKLSTEYLSSMTVAADYAGVSQDSLFKSIQKLTIGVGEAGRGIGQAKDTLNDLGISVYDATGKLKTADQLLPVLADKFSNMEDSTKRLEMAQKLFGQRNTQILQLLNQGSGALEAYTKRAELMGVVVGSNAARNAALFNDTIADSKRVLQGLKNVIGEQVMPYITGLATMFNDFVTNNRIQIIDFGKSFLQVMLNIGEKGAYAVALLIDAWRGLRMTYEVLKIGLSTMVEAMLTGLNIIIEKVTNFTEKLNFGGILDDELERIKNFNSGMEGVLDTMQETRAGWQANLEDLASKSFALEKVDEYVNKTKEAMSELQNIGTAAIESKKEQNEIEAEILIEKLENENIIKEEAQQTYLAAFEEYQQKLTDTETQADLKRLDDFLSTLSQEDKAYYKSNAAKLKDLSDTLKKEEKEELEQQERRRENEKKILLERFTNIKLNDEQRKQLTRNTENALYALRMAGGRKGFEAAKGLAISEAIIKTYEGAQAAFASLSGIPIVGPGLAAAAAAAAIIAGLGRVSQIKSQTYSAHGGMTSVPKEQTYLLDQGERILSPNQNKDFTDFIKTNQGGGNNIENLNIEILPNATNAEALRYMSRQDWLDIAENNIIPAMRELSAQGVTV